MDNSVLNRLEILLERKIHRKSLYEFYKAAFCQLHPGVAYDENWHARYLCEVLQEEAWRIKRKEKRKRDIIINIPFRSSKSVLTTVIFPVWCWACVDPSLKFITTSYSADLALEHAVRSKDLIKTVWFQRLYGRMVTLRSDLNAAGHFETIDMGMRKSVGTGGQITGSGGDILIIDDPQNPKKASSEVERVNCIEFYDHTLYSRLNDPDVGVRIIIQQRLHEQDLTGHLMSPRDGRPDDHQHICIPAELDLQVLSPKSLEKYYTNGLFWESRFSKQTLASYKKALGTLQFAGQMGQRPVPPEGNLFKRKWFEIVKPEMITRDPGVSPIHFFIDTAYTEDETEKNDPSGILTAFIKDDIVYIVNFVEVWMEFPKLIEFIKQYVTLNGYSSGSGIFIEPKASGKSVAQQLKAGTQLNVIEIEADWVKDDKVQRATSVSPIAQSGRVKIIEGPWNDLYLGYLTSFPKAMHDEAVDCTVYTLNYMIPINDFLAGFI